MSYHSVTNKVEDKTYSLDVYSFVRSLKQFAPPRELHFIIRDEEASD